MGRIITRKITNFNKGITVDPRNPDNSFARIVKNYDISTFPYKMIPYRSSESGDSAATTSKKRNFAIGLNSVLDPDAFTLYALGVKSGATTAEVLYKNLTTSGSNDLSDAGWTNSGIAAKYQSVTGTATSFNLFVYYRSTGLIYGARDGTNIWSYDTTETANFNDTEQALTYTSIGQGLVHSKDGILYIPYHNSAGSSGSRSFIASNSGGSWNTTALTLPDHFIPVSLTEYGNYLAVGCKNVNSYGKAYVFLWDRASSLPTETIDFGTGRLEIIENIGGILIGISFFASVFDDRFIFRSWGGGTTVAQEFLKLKSEATVGSAPFGNPVLKQRIGNSIYFLMDWTAYGQDLNALYRLHKNPNDTISLSLFRTADNDNSVDSIYSFFIVGDYVFIAYDPNGSDSDALSKTNDTNVTNHNCDYETIILNEGESFQTKKLLGVTVLHDPLPANGSVSLAYAKDEDVPDSSFTTILTNTTDNTIRDSAVKVESTGANLPVYKELVFRIRATCSSGKPPEITGLIYQYEEIDDDKYNHKT